MAVSCFGALIHPGILRNIFFNSISHKEPRQSFTSQGHTLALYRKSTDDITVTLSPCFFHLLHVMSVSCPLTSYSHLLTSRFVISVMTNPSGNGGVSKRCFLLWSPVSYPSPFIINRKCVHNVFWGLLMRTHHEQVDTPFLVFPPAADSVPSSYFSRSLSFCLSLLCLTLSPVRPLHRLVSTSTPLSLVESLKVKTESCFFSHSLFLSPVGSLLCFSFSHLLFFFIPVTLGFTSRSRFNTLSDGEKDKHANKKKPNCSP